MALQFPTEPEPNERYTYGNRTWKWNTRFWEAVSTTIGYAGSGGYAGSQGITGYWGSKGYTGSLGYIGSTGYTGSTGTQGITGYWGSFGYVGSKGLSAYEVAVAKGFVGTEIQWLASLVPPTLVPKPNSGVAISNNTLTTVYNTLVPDSTNSIAIGGAGVLPASTWKTKSIVEVLDTILFPDQAPTYTYPAIQIQSTFAGPNEVGVIYTQQITLLVVKNDAGALSRLQITKNGTPLIPTTPAPLQGAAGDVAAQFGYADPNNPNYYYKIISVQETGISTTSSSVSWSGSAFYAAGLPKQNNKGVTSTNFIAAGSLNSDVVTVTGIYPWFWGVSSEASPFTAARVANIIYEGTSTKNLSNASGTISITFNAYSQFLWFAIPATYANKTKWLNVGNATNTGDIGTPDGSITSGFMKRNGTVNVNSPTVLWSSVSYTIYISPSQQTTNGVYQFY